MPILNLSFPENVNPLSPNGFWFSVQKLPEVTYFCQQIELPSVSLPTANQATPFVEIGHKGEQLDYADLTIQFIVDSKMANYKAINRWMTDGFPDNAPPEDFHSDGQLIVLDANNNAVQTIQFANLIPISLDGLTFSATNNDVQYLIGSATFRYTYYTFV